MATTAVAPLRVSFGGGGTDLPAYAHNYGGHVVSSAIAAYARTTVRWSAGCRDVQWVPGIVDDDPDGIRRALDLARAVADVLTVEYRLASIDVHVSCDGPLGAGLGSSSAIVVAVCGAVLAHAEIRTDRYSLASLAYRVEREELGHAGGAQDHFAAAFGGLNFIDFGGVSGTGVSGLRVPEGTPDLLRRSLVLCDTATRRVSSDLIRQQIDRIEAGDGRALAALHAIKLQALEVRAALVTGDIPRLARSLDHGWHEKKKLADGVTTARIDRLYEAAISSGALGVRVLGAGGGGCMIAAAPPQATPAVAEALRNAGGRILPLAFDDRGVRTWTGATVDPPAVSPTDRQAT